MARGGRVPARDRQGNVIDCVSWDAVAKRFEIQVMVNGLRKAARMPASTTPTELATKREDMKALLRASDKHKALAGTLHADALVFLNAWTGVNRDSITRKVMIWVDALGRTTKRSDVTKVMIATQLARFGDEPFVRRKGEAQATRPYSVEQRRKLLRVLRQWFAMLDGENAPNPAREVKMPSAPKPEARALDIEVAERILDSMPASVTRARLKLILRFGITPAEMKRMQRVHMHERRGVLTVLARRKGKGAEARALPYGRMTDAVEALQEFASYDAWAQPFSVASMRASFISAAEGCNVFGARPYDLRHTCGTELYRTTGDIRMVQKWLGHTKVETTVRYILGGDDDAMNRAAEAMQRAAEERKRKRSTSAEDAQPKRKAS